MAASHGCLRLPADGTDGFNAWWIYSHIPKRTVLIVVDDYARRVSEAIAEKGYTAASPVKDESTDSADP